MAELLSKQTTGDKKTEESTDAIGKSTNAAPPSANAATPTAASGSGLAGLANSTMDDTKVDSHSTDKSTDSSPNSPFMASSISAYRFIASSRCVDHGTGTNDCRIVVGSDA